MQADCLICTYITKSYDKPKSCLFFLFCFRVSLVLSETVDAGLFGEHILSTLQHAWQDLLLPLGESQDSKSSPGVVQPQTFPCNKSPHGSESDLGRQEGNSANSVTEMENMSISNRKYILPQNGRVIPARAEVFVALISCNYVAKQTKYLGSDIECLKNKHVHVRLEEPYMSEKLNRVPGGFKLLSEWFQVTAIDFNSQEDIAKHLTGEVDKMLTLKCTENGPLDAIALAFDLHLDEENCIRTFPDSSIQTVWENAVYPVIHPLSVASGDAITLDFQCSGVIKVAVQDQAFSSSSNQDSVNLSTNALRFINSKSFVDAFKAAAHQAFLKLQECSKRNKSTNNPISICDGLPFPVAGLYLQSLLPDSQLYVEDEDIQKVLQEMGINVKLCEELQEESLDVLFLWPMTQEGTLTDGIIEKAKTYRYVPVLCTNTCLFFHK